MLCFSSLLIFHAQEGINRRRSGRVVECTPLLRVQVRIRASRVRIPPSPPISLLFPCLTGDSINFTKIPKSFKTLSSFFQKRLCCACTQRCKRVLTGNKKTAATQFVQRATRILERVKGVEPSSLAWKARVIAVIRHPQLRSWILAYSFKVCQDRFAISQPLI